MKQDLVALDASLWHVSTLNYSNELNCSSNIWLLNEFLIFQLFIRHLLLCSYSIIQSKDLATSFFYFNRNSIAYKSVPSDI